MKKLSNIVGTLSLFTLLLVAFPLAWFFLDKFNVLSYLGFIDSDNLPSEWSIAFIGYFGSAVAAIAGYIAVILSLNIQNKARREDNAKEVLPLISALTTCSNGLDRSIIYLKHAIQLKNEGSSNDKTTSKHLSRKGILLKNVGMREMYDVEIMGIESDFFTTSSVPVELAPILYKGDSIAFDIMLEASGLQSECIEITEHTFKNKSYARVVISVAYKDCYSNCYIQKIEAKASYNFEVRKIPELIFSNAEVDDHLVVSAPLLQD